VKATPSRRIADACSGRLVGLLRCTRGVPASDIPVIYDPAEESIAASPENSGRASRPDDETLGCGGLITILARGGSAFSFVFVTDGGASHPRSVSWSRSRLASRREAEAIEALHRLGVGHAPRCFLRLADAAIPPEGSPEWDAAIARVENIIRDFQPHLMLLPWRRDPHRDHRDSWRLARIALQHAGAHPLILEYAIWLDELGAPEDRPRQDEAAPIVLDVREALGHKQAAIAAHASQTTALIDDDPTGFRLTATTIARLVKPTETFWRSLHAGD
jgi:LmbE family N-acetylglucosaminyl deacetylase